MVHSSTTPRPIPDGAINYSTISEATRIWMNVGDQASYFENHEGADYLYAPVAPWEDGCVKAIDSFNGDGYRWATLEAVNANCNQVFETYLLTDSTVIRPIEFVVRPEAIVFPTDVPINVIVIDNL
jgi:hypothetical protein